MGNTRDFPALPRALKDVLELGQWLGRLKTWADALVSRVTALDQAEVHVVSGDTSIDPSWDVVEYNGPGAHTLTLPSAQRAGVRRGRPLRITNNGAASITIATSGSDVTGTTTGRTMTLPTGSVVYLESNGDAVWRALGAAFKAFALTLAGTLDVTGQATLRGLTVWPGASSGSPVTAMLLGDLRQFAIGTVNQFIIGNLASGAGCTFGQNGGTTIKAGWYGATPIAQQVLPTGAGKTVDDVIAFLQLWGPVRQS